MTNREIIEKELSKLTLGQFDQLVLSAMNEKRENLIIEDNLHAIIRGVFEYLDKENIKLIVFLYHIKDWTKNPILRGAVGCYIGQLSGKPIIMGDPYKEIVVFGEPFVDRDELREKLKILFKANSFKLLSVKGPRYCGRSHGRLLIQHIALREGIETLPIDLKTATVESMIDDFINEMFLPYKEVMDRLQQPSTRTRGFCSVLRAFARNFTQPWCILFDHHDLPDVSPEAKDFAELLIQDVAENRLPNVFIIVLGQGTWNNIAGYLKPRILEAPLVNLDPLDVDRFLAELDMRNNNPTSPADILSRRAQVFHQLPTPLDWDGMIEMGSRLRQLC